LQFLNGVNNIPGVNNFNLSWVPQDVPAPADPTDSLHHDTVKSEVDDGNVNIKTDDSPPPDLDVAEEDQWL
jgi:hypothetical protein